MATLSPQERLQPALLDRLIDEAPDKAQEPKEVRLISARKLRAAVLRDLAWLFNATRLGGEIENGRTPYAARSVINFGLPAMSGTTASTLDVGDLESRMRQAILDFEPRLMPATLQVRTVVSQLAMDHYNQVQVEIRGHLWAQPVPIELLLRTEVDLETSEVRIKDMGG